MPYSFLTVFLSLTLNYLPYFISEAKNLCVHAKINSLFQPGRFQILSRIFNNGLVMQHFREKNCTSHIHCCYLILCYLFCSPNETRWWILWIKLMITFWLNNLEYRTRAIITRGLYVFTPLLKSISLFKEVFWENSVLKYG